MSDGHDTFLGMFLHSSKEAVNRALEVAGFSLRLEGKLADQLHFRDGDMTFQVSEMELLATDVPVLEYLLSKVPGKRKVGPQFELLDIVTGDVGQEAVFTYDRCDNVAEMDLVQAEITVMEKCDVGSCNKPRREQREGIHYCEEHACPVGGAT